MSTSGKFQAPARTFERVDNPRIKFSGFDLSHRHTTTFDIGQVIPIALLETIPNDRWSLSAETVLRMQPLIAPILHPIKLKIEAWFGSFRYLMEDEEWERFLAGGDDGTEVVNLPLFDPSTTVDPGNAAARGSLYDRFGFNPVGTSIQLADAVKPLAFAHRMYTKMWNDWFRIPGIQPEIDIFDEQAVYLQPFYANWSRDYFVSSLPFLQRGVSPSLPVLGSIDIDADFNITNQYGTQNIVPIGTKATSGAGLAYSDSGGGIQDPDAAYDAAMEAGLSATTNLSTVDIKQVRLAFLYQQFLERMARGGARLAEMYPNIWGARPLDQRLQRIEYIGGFTSNFITSEVLQTAPQTDNGVGGDTTPQGTMAGHGINLMNGFLGKYRVDEHGYIMITATVMPDAMYSQGMPRSQLRRVREEFPSPSFVGLSEQEIFNAELYNQDIAADPTGSVGRTPFGYTGRYNEMRFQPSVATSWMRDTFDYWHLGRKFGSLPNLSTEFVNAYLEASGAVTPVPFKRIFAVQDEPGLIGTFGIRAEVVRPIPFMAIPATLGGA